jgi:hypothetical protein
MIRGPHLREPCERPRHLLCGTLRDLRTRQRNLLHNNNIYCTTTTFTTQQRHPLHTKRSVPHTKRKLLHRYFTRMLRGPHLHQARARPKHLVCGKLRNLCERQLNFPHNNDIHLRILKYTRPYVTLGRCPLSIFCPRGTPPREVDHCTKNEVYYTQSENTYTLLVCSVPPLHEPRERPRHLVCGKL